MASECLRDAYFRSQTATASAFANAPSRGLHASGERVDADADDDGDGDGDELAFLRVFSSSFKSDGRDTDLVVPGSMRYNPALFDSGERHANPYGNVDDPVLSSGGSWSESCSSRDPDLASSSSLNADAEPFVPGNKPQTTAVMPIMEEHFKK